MKFAKIRKIANIKKFSEIVEIFKKFQNRKKTPIFQNCKNLQKTENLPIFEKWPKSGKISELDKFSEIADIYFQKISKLAKKFEYVAQIFENFRNRTYYSRSRISKEFQACFFKNTNNTIF